MEICPVPDRFSATHLRFGNVPKLLVRTRTSFFPCIAASNLRQKTDIVEPESRNRMFIMGMGFVGQFFAQNLKNQGWVVSGTCTSIMKKKKLEEMGFNVYVFDANEPEPEVLNILSYHTHFLISIPPLLGIDDPMLQHEELLKSRLKDGNLQWLCYLSSTSVYGNCGGAWVDEDYPVSPTSEKARARLVAEDGWLNLGHDLGLSAQIFRLGGIYGPGRSAVDTIIKQEPLSEIQKMRASRHYTSRVHVADICQALEASIYKPSPGKTYNIVDDDPAPRIEIFTFARDLIQKKWPGQMKQTTSPDRDKSFIPEGSSRGEKRVSNARMKKELGVRLLHPSYRSGLQSVIAHMDNPFLGSS
uniref:Putative dTDP-D-glucose 4,6-dehydratase n=1 Tax=Davidia involucrata TaxID=16924 RepID=A0A5B7BPM1_DAVIN